MNFKQIFFRSVKKTYVCTSIGLKWTLFCTKLLGDGVYTPIALKLFYLIESAYDKVNLTAMVEVFSIVKVCTFYLTNNLIPLY